jgi:hypothetical protein
VNESLGSIKTPQVEKIVAEDNKFRRKLDQSITENSEVLDSNTAKKNLAKLKETQLEVIPKWVDQDYGFDPANPRKPNMREIMEAMSGRSVEELYKDPTSNWIGLSSQASEILYGVTATVAQDTRNWEAIMDSNNIVAAAGIETGAMLEPQVKIETNYNNETEISEQFAILSDNNGKVLRTLVGPTHAVERILLNYGATKSSIPHDFTSSVDLNKFDNDIFHLLENYNGNSKSLIEIGRQTATSFSMTNLIEKLELDLQKGYEEDS